MVFFAACSLARAQRSKRVVDALRLPCWYAVYEGSLFSDEVGACIVNDRKQILSLGYNSMPNGCPDDKAWDKNKSNPLESKEMYVCHAELNAIVNKNSADVRGACIYVTHFPCEKCAKLIIQSDITSVVYYHDNLGKKYPSKPSKEMFEVAKVEYREYTKSLKLNLTFEQFCKNTKISNPSESTSQLYSAIRSWDEYFMSFAFLSAHYSEEGGMKRGACLVNKQHRIVGMPRRRLEIFTTEGEQQTLKKARHDKTLCTCHVPVNAILNKNCWDLNNCSLYVTHFPCNECAKFIVQSGITKVNYYCDSGASDGARRIFDLADIEYLEYTKWQELCLPFCLSNLLEEGFPHQEVII
ncbi:Cytidine and deoxycytidylate deaminase domain [Trinorchestia longiramus]|nr:Cytidine and deoxycytidylate deaminase domain [Trinorchestia longiramus]